MSNFGRYNSPGFIYFNSNASSDSAELPSFNNSFEESFTSNRHGFSPSCYSSPKYNSPRSNLNMKPPSRFSPKVNNWGRSLSHNSTGDSFSGSYSSQHQRQSQNNRSKSSTEGRDMSAFIDPTCLLDPWEELVKGSKSDDNWKELEEQAAKVESDSSEVSEALTEKPAESDGESVDDSDGSSSGSSDNSGSSGNSGSDSGSSVTVQVGKT